MPPKAIPKSNRFITIEKSLKSEKMRISVTVGQHNIIPP